MWIRIETVADDYCFNVPQLLEYAARRVVQDKHRLASGEINNMYLEQFIRDAEADGVHRSLALYCEKFDPNKIK